MLLAVRLVLAESMAAKGKMAAAGASSRAVREGAMATVDMEVAMEPAVAPMETLAGAAAEMARAAIMAAATAAATAQAGPILLVLLPREIRENLQAANGSGGRLPVSRF